ncbi:MAG TPA: MarR family transcriptional regulator [Luteitalea sp.]|nr:MarR family transcriptional regulator [Luteitalea sp.]
MADGPASTLPPILEFMQSLWAVVHRMERLSKRMGARTGVTGPQRLVVRLIHLYPGIGAGELAATLHLHPSTLTGLLKRLETQGLLSRHVDPADGRRIVLRVTRRGATVATGRAGTVEGAVAAVTESAPTGQTAHVQAFLGALAVRLDHEMGRGAPRHRARARRSRADRP